MSLRSTSREKQPRIAVPPTFAQDERRPPRRHSPAHRLESAGFASSQTAVVLRRRVIIIAAMSSILFLSMMKRTCAFSSIPRIQQHTRALHVLAAGSSSSYHHAQQSSSCWWTVPGGGKNAQSSNNGSTRLYSFNRFGGGDDDDNNNVKNKKQGFLATLKNKAKQYFPFLRTEQEQQAAIEKQRVKSELQSSIQQVLRGAPLPIRAMGGLVGSLLGSAVSELAQVASQQNDLIDRYYGQGVTALTTNAAVQAALGNPVQVGPITSQSSSTTNINGRSMTRVQMGFTVYGSRTGGSGQARLSVQTTAANNDNNIDPPPTLQVQLHTGQVLSVPMDDRRSSSSSSSFDKRFSSSNQWNNNKDDDTVIEAEIIDKKPSR